jgi:chloramphenicol O-acetyltransferase
LLWQREVSIRILDHSVALHPVTAKVTRKAVALPFFISIAFTYCKGYNGIVKYNFAFFLKSLQVGEVA